MIRKAAPRRRRTSSGWNPEELLFQLRLLRVPEPVREFRFHETRRWRADFAWPKYGLAVEIDGGLFTHGRHSRGAGMLADMEKYNELTHAGWAVLRYAPAQVRSAFAAQDIKRFLVPRIKNDMAAEMVYAVQGGGS